MWPFHLNKEHQSLPTKLPTKKYLYLNITIFWTSRGYFSYLRRRFPLFWKTQNSTRNLFKISPDERMTAASAAQHSYLHSCVQGMQLAGNTMQKNQKTCKTKPCCFPTRRMSCSRSCSRQPCWNLLHASKTDWHLSNRVRSKVMA